MQTHDVVIDGQVFLEIVQDSSDDEPHSRGVPSPRPSTGVLITDLVSDIYGGS